jgi:diguanylate cyclase (GGDEF)-like protein/PAS domain S-box-containing protein
MAGPVTTTYRHSVDQSVSVCARARPVGALDLVSTRGLLAIGMPVVILLMVLTVLDAGGQKVLWENGHWTAAGLLAAFLATSAVRAATGPDRFPRVLIAGSACLWLGGQLAWDLQTALGFFALPAPSDIGFLFSVVPATLALTTVLRRRLARAEELAVYLDAAAIFLAISALIFSLYGEAMIGHGWLATAVTIAYPIVHFATAGAAFVALLAVRSELRLRGGYFLVISFAILGVSWVGWLRQAALGLPPAGGPVNFLFSFGIIGLGLAGTAWRMEEAGGRRTRSAATLAHGGLPLLGLVIAAIVLIGHPRHPGEVGLVDVAGIGVILLAGLRQTLLVHERGQLLDGSQREHRELEIALVQRAEADNRYRTLVEHVPAAVYIDVADKDVSDGGRLAYMSPQIEGILGYHPDAFINDPELWPRLIHEDDKEAALSSYLAHWATGQPLRIEYRMLGQNGSMVWVRDEAYAIPDEDGGGHRLSQGMLIDTTEQKRLEARLIHDALHDPLTGLANRVLFRDHVERALRRRGRSRSSAAILFLDLDDFKVVNDSLGHRAGDRLLIEVARRLSETTRGGDVAARQGGDEFTILLERVGGIEGAVLAAERLTAELHRPIELDGRMIVIGASIGIAVSNGPKMAADDLLAHADAAMYEAKAHGKARHAVFDPSMRLRARSRLESEAELRAAVDTRAFVIHYQPIMELASSRIVGFEALVRWNHPERGLVPPGEFIPLAEATGLIVPLGRFVLEQACRDLRSWRDRAQGRAGLTMSVNVSPRQTVVAGFATEVREVLATSGIEPAAMTLEITESLVLAESGTSDGALRELRDLGVRLAVDDFGTGFSALEYFKRFVVHELKIDRTFVDGLGRTREDTAIVTATLAFASALGLSVTAEGVETAGQAERLQTLGCQRAQGYHFGRPMPARDVAVLLGITDVPAAGGDGVQAA